MAAMRKLQGSTRPTGERQLRAGRVGQGNAASAWVAQTGGAALGSLLSSDGFAQGYWARVGYPASIGNHASSAEHLLPAVRSIYD